jgi:hypothetical protein
MFDMAGWRKLVDEFHDLLSGLPEGITAVKLTPDRWSLREIVGHLIDSASNNHQRFVRLQRTALLEFPGYAGEAWVEQQKYNDLDWPTITELWFLFNRLLLHLVGTLEPAALGNLWRAGDQNVSLEWLVHDYYRHLAEHLAHFRRRLDEVSSPGSHHP